MKYPLISTVIIFFFLLGAVRVVSAHATGVSYEVPVGEYLIDIGRDSERVFTDSPVIFDFNLYHKDGRTETPFTSVWLRIVKDDKVIFAGGIARPQLGKMTALMQLALPGTYQISTRFENEGATVAEASFPLQVFVAQSSGHSVSTDVFSAGGGALVGALAMFLFTRRKN